MNTFPLRFRSSAEKVTNLPLALRRVSDPGVTTALLPPLDRLSSGVPLLTDSLATSIPSWVIRTYPFDRMSSVFGPNE